MKTIAITGATGAIGMALIRKSIAEDVNVLVFIRPDSPRRDRIPNDAHVRIIECELSKIRECYIDEKCDVFYHFAWAGTFGDSRNDMDLQAGNADNALDAVRLAKRMGAKAFIGAGSQAEYGRVEGLLTADTQTNPENGYGIYKLKAGSETRQLCAELGMSHVWTRILSVYGPYDGSATMIMSTISKMLRGEKPSLTKGEQIWDYLYCDDAANAMFLLGEAAASDDRRETVSGQIYVIGSGIGRPLREYIEVMRDIINPDLELGFGEIAYGPKQVMHLQADITDLQRDVGFVPAFDFEKGIKQTIEFVKASNESN